MKIVRYRHAGVDRLGAVNGDQVVDLAAALAAATSPAVSREEAARRAASLLPVSMRAFLASGAEAREAADAALGFAAANPDRAFLQPLADAHLLPPIGDPQKIICIGQNYRDHCLEQNQPIPERAIIFAKFPTALTGHRAPIVVPRLSRDIDYEAELAFVIGRRGRHIPEERAREYVAGYMCLNDVSARDIQFGDKQWVRGKTFDTFAPCGPALVTADEVPNPQALDIRLALNGTVMQKSNTSNLVFGVDYLVSYLSEVMTLEPGDIVSTGTPGGVGTFRKPPVYLKPGDEVSITIERLGTLTNPVVSE